MFTYAYVRHVLAVGSVYLGVSLLGACGSEAEFHGIGGFGSKKTDSPAPTNPGTDDAKSKPIVTEDDVIIAPAGNLLWLWECNNTARPAELTANDDVKIWGMGEHTVQRTDRSFPLEISGPVCNPLSGVRDVVFIADVSSSMGGLGGADRKDSNGNCGRKRAVEKVINSMPTDGRARVAVMTFGRDVKKNSGGFISIEAAKQNFVKSDILCAAIDTTNYKAPLQLAINYFKTARPGATREIYFISDGEPGSDDTNGSAAAKILREQYGVTIATMMIKGDDTVLINHIASRDVKNQPMHTKVDNADQLVAAIGGLSERRVSGAKVRLRAIGDDIWDERGVNLNEGAEFSWSVPEFNASLFPEGLEFELDYWDQHDRHYGGKGKLLWE